MRALVDTCVFQHAIVSEPTIREVSIEWGGRRFVVPVATTKLKDIPEGWLGHQIAALRFIADAARSGRLTLYLAPEVRTELLGAPAGAFPGHRSNLFHDVPFEAAPDPLQYGRVVIAAFDPPGAFSKRLRQFVNGIQDSDFAYLRAALGATKVVDAFHILTAERAGLDALLTTDRRLINTVRAATNWRFRVRVLSPVELADALRSDV